MCGIVLAGAVANHGGLTPAAPWSRQVCHRTRVVSPSEMRFLEAPRAHARRSSSACDDRMCSEDRMCTSTQSCLSVRFPHHGWLTPAALDERAFVHRKSRKFRRQRLALQGTRAGGVSPPWLTEMLMHRRALYRTVALAHAIPGAGGVSPPWCGKRKADDVTAHISARKQARA